MVQGDIRAVENPISAIFDLAEDVNREAPRIRKMVTYASLFIGIWLGIDLILILATLGAVFFVSIMLLVLFIFGILALAMLRNFNDFFRYYVMRHAAIVSVRNDDPIVHVPKGDTAVQRVFSYIAGRNPPMNQARASGKFQAPAIVRGASGVFYNLDGYLASRPAFLWRVLGTGYPGYQLFIKSFQSPPRPEDLTALKNAAFDVSVATSSPPSRVIALWCRKETQELLDDAYALLSTAPIIWSHMGKKFACSLELIIENEDGSYEFIPYMADRPTSLRLF
jgi:hypothetical protein